MPKVPIDGADGDIARIDKTVTQLIAEFSALNARVTNVEQLLASKPWDDPPPPPEFVDRQTKPNSTNTGPRKPLRIETGTQRIGARTIDGVEFQGLVILDTGVPTLTDCAITGPVAYDPAIQGALVYGGGSNSGRMIAKHTRIRPRVDSGPGWHTVQIKMIDAYRCDISGMVDALYLSGAIAGTRLRCSYLHDVAYRAPNPFQPDNVTHNDLIQFGGDILDAEIDGCTLAGTLDPLFGTFPRPPGASQCVMIGPAGTRIDGLRFLYDWIEGPANFGINVTRAWGESTRTVNRFEVGFCRFGRDWVPGPDFAINAPIALHSRMNVHDNVRADGGGGWEPWNAIKAG